MNKYGKWALGLLLWSILVIVIFATALMPATTNQDVDMPELDYGSSYVIVFFGFPSCNSACPTTLSFLSRLTYDWKHDSIAMPPVLFINIDEESTSFASMEYAKAYNPNFLGYMPSEKEFSRFKDQFGLNIHKLKNDISHMARSYLVHHSQDKWTIIKAYNPGGFTLSQLESDLLQLEP